METKNKKLTNFKVIEKQDIRGNTYYIIFDNDNEGNNNAYFCWKESVKNGFDDLVKNKDTAKELDIEWEPKEKGNKVVSVWCDGENNNGFEFII